ncbi:serine protease [Kitasatospora sp. GP82]|uniref:S1 family peptidase n=1 Tax=Kitasatospora sp. GP82 TaxID=3035089 RepID=UPI0024765BE3|nr:serine protease [Kitasatospora sp. GP82]MDH6127756.1 secreted trypsin-like serine protease [Kitasatospora sp. GP82]
MLPILDAHPASLLPRRRRRRVVALALLAALPAPLIALTAAAPAEAQRRIVGGKAVSTGNHRWMVALASRQQFGNARAGQFCGGTLVAPTKVVTAAHCFYDETSGRRIDRPGLKVIVGRDDLTRRNGREVEVREVLVHPEYSYATNMQDVAVLTIAEAQPETSLINYVEPGETEPYVPGAKAQVYGWGDTRGDGSYSNTLHSVDVPIIADETCAHAYPGGPDGLFDARGMVCAGDQQGGKDACQGDSGGPLVVAGRLAGLVSWGAGCAEANHPGVYTRVSAVSDWLHSVL